MAGETETGVTAMYMDEGLDTGDVILCEKVVIGAEDDFEAAGLALFGTAEMAIIVSVGTGALISLAYVAYLAKALPDAEQAR